MSSELIHLIRLLKYWSAAMGICAAIAAAGAFARSNADDHTAIGELKVDVSNLNQKTADLSEIKSDVKQLLKAVSRMEGQLKGRT